MHNFLPNKWRRDPQQQPEFDSQVPQISGYQLLAYDKLMDFYRNNQSMFDDYFSTMRTPSERKDFIKDVYSALHYTDPTSPPQHNNGLTLYRGLVAQNAQDIQNYTSSLVDGEVVFGKKAQLHGTGIYMTTNADVAMKYAMHGGEYGSIVQCETVGGMTLADGAQLTADKEAILKLMCSQNQDDPNVLMYSNFLNDNGVFASIIGYDGINIPEKDYVLVLNRGSIAVDEISYYREGQEISQDDLNYELQTADIEITEDMDEITEDVEMTDIIQ